MKLRTVQPVSEIAPYIALFWIFESDAGLPADDSRIVIPNGTSKIIVPVRNALYTPLNDREYESKEQKIHFSGVWDKPTVISSMQSFTCTIGIDLTPKGTARLFPFNMKECKNLVFSLEDLFGSTGHNTEEELANIESLDGKVAFLQQLLARYIHGNKRQNVVFDFCIDEINRSKGMTEIKTLEKKTGYSSRYLDMIFNDCIGLSPKTYSGIVRFNHFYTQYARTGAADFYSELLYEFYYDQSHFIKEFKRFTSYSPKQFAKTDHQFGKLFL